MKVYLAAPYAARDRIREYALQLTEAGHEVTSSWLKEQHEINAGTVGAAAALSDDQVAAHAHQDFVDVAESSDALVLFTAAAAGVDPATNVSGGRHVETGFAIARGLLVVVVGDPENVFHRAAELCTVVPTFDQVAEALRSVRCCRVCGCTDARACQSFLIGPCWWVEPDLCSECQGGGA